MVLSIFGARLVQLQGIDPRSYAAMAAAEGMVDVVLPAERGEITDRFGEPLADSVDGLMVIADPQLVNTDEDGNTVDRAPELAKFLANKLDLDYFTILPRLRAQDSRFQYIARSVPATLATQVVARAQALGFDGLTTRRDQVRTYPADDVAANLVGFLGTPDDDGNARPLAGLERTFDGLLSGTDGSARYTVAGGAKVPLGESTVTKAVDGQDLHTTIDRDLQWYAQRVLRQTVQDAGGDSGVAVVMDARTGQTLALADFPTFDANAPLESPEADLGARSISDVYEPGSVEKVLTMSALIDAGKVTDKTRLLVPGSLARQDRVIHDWFPHDVIRLTLAGVLAKSSNIGTVLAADRFDDGQLRSYLSAFGLGQATAAGIRGESPGILPDPSMWTSQTQDRIAFGQSVSVNALQMTAAINTIANDGVRIDPSLVIGAATTDDGTQVGTDTVTERRVVSTGAARQTARMMERVIDPEAGVAPGAAVPGYRVAGKTGTAQRASSECGCYDGTFTVSFAGFAPADDP
ncbi:MAG: penicillin-binding protein 2, partial [Actinobacteria bacterium]|nr:penicillin-binding protein 2 [Actinomycetota bacterium]